MLTKDNKIVLKAVGDLMLGDHPVCFGHGIKSTIEKKGFKYILDDACKKRLDADILFGNLESVLSNKGMLKNDLYSQELRGRPDEAKVLAEVGFNYLNIANNHSLQHGQAAFNETVELLNKNKINTLGLAQNGKSEVLSFNLNGVNVVLIAYSLCKEKYHPGKIPYSHADQKTILKHVEEVRKQNKGTIVISLHWGNEYLNYPSKNQIEFAHNLVDSGAGLVLGHHPHVLQGIERYKQSIIVYSLGNFIFDKWQRSPRETIIFSCEITTNGISNYSFDTMLINKNFKLIKPSVDESLIIENKINRYSHALAMINKQIHDYKDWDKKYENLAKHAYSKFRIESYLYFISHIYRYKPHVIKSSLSRFFLRRLGKA